MSGPGKKRGASDNPAPIIIVRKKVGHAGHHGGAWKVAYADFVTTMMALFIVLWAAGQDSSTRESIAAYFRSPTIIPNTVKGSGVLPQSTGIVASADVLANEPAPQRETRLLRDMAERIKQEMEKAPDLRPLIDQVQITITEEGMRIQIIERDEHLFFEVGSAKVKPALTQLLAIIGAAIGKVPNPVVLEGHTDSRQYSQQRGGYSNWELSTDRANSARRILEADGLRAGQVIRVVGFADQDLLHKENPLDPQNRRVSILVRRMGDARAAQGAASFKPGDAAARLAAKDVRR